jgi:cysteine synthase A
MKRLTSVCDAIGNTPLIRLQHASELTGCHIYGKAEWMNPGASVKDRAALGMVRDAEARGLLEPGGTIVEGTAGNTGIGLAVVGNALGYRVRIVMPNTQSQEKVDTLRAYGAQVKLIPAVPYRNPEHFVHTSKRDAEALASTNPRGAFWANQFDNTANRQMHAATTAQEIFEQTGGRVDGFICAVGTGGTLGGVAYGLRERRPEVKIGLADPTGSALYNHFVHGELKVEGSSISEGIGNSRITANLEGVDVDMAFRIPDSESVPLVFELMRREGLCLGSSSGVNVAGAIRMARELGPGHTIVTILCDSGLRYLRRLYNPQFLRSKDLPVPDWLDADPITGAGSAAPGDTTR